MIYWRHAMRIAIVSDIHANLAALEAVLADADVVTEIWCSGDIVGYGPNPNECIELLRLRQATCIAGNHDWAAIGRLSTADFNPDAAAAAQWTASTLTPENVRYLEDLPLTEVLDSFTLAHGTLKNPIWEYMVSASQATDSFALLKTRYGVVGHTHVPAMYVETGATGASQLFPPPYGNPIQLGSDRAIFNPGSVGQPRDGIPEASYAIVDLDAHTIQYRRVAYDIARTQRQMRLDNLPPRLWQRLDYGW